MKNVWFSIGLLFSCLLSSAQYLQRLEQKLKQAKTDREKILALDSLSLYYTFFFEGEGSQDSTAYAYGDQQIALALQSRDPELMVLAPLLHGQNLSTYGFFAPSITRADSLLKIAVRIAQDNHFPLYEAFAYVHLAEVYLNILHIDLNRAAQYLVQAQSIASLQDNDSLKILVNLIAGSLEKAKNNNIAALRYYISGLRQAEQLNIDALAITANNLLADFYDNLGDQNKALDYGLSALAKSKQLQCSMYILYSYVTVFIHLNYGAKRYAEGRKYAIEAYYSPAMIHQNDIYTIGALWHIYYSYFGEKNYSKAKAFYATHPEVALGMKIFNAEFINVYINAHVLQAEGKTDSAIYLYQKAIEIANELKDSHGVQIIYQDFGNFLLEQKKLPQAITVLLQLQSLCDSVRNLGGLATTYSQLQDAYAQSGNKAKAYDYLLLYVKLNDSLQKLSDKKQLALLEVDNENKRLQLLAQREEERLRRRHNLQYMAITAGLATAFILLALLGFFSTSTAVIKGVGFFSFIFFFEFVILLADNLIHHWTHGEPLKVLAIKIGLIAVLFPFHHYIEERVTHYFIHRKKLRLHRGLFRPKV